MAFSARTGLWSFRCAQRRRHAAGRHMTVPAGSLAGVGGLTFFIAAWYGYHFLLEAADHGRGSLNSRMDAERAAWMRNLLTRDNRIVDASLLASLQNGTAFFASTSLIAVGGSLALLRSSEDLM